MLVGKERGEIIIWIRDNYYVKSEIFRLENEMVILLNVCRIVQGQPYEGLCKINKEPMKDYKKISIY
jgi:hypothetical protein